MYRFVGQTMLTDELARLFGFVFVMGIWVLLVGLIKGGLSSWGLGKGCVNVARGS